VLGAGLPQVMAWPQSPAQAIKQWREMMSVGGLQAARIGKQRYPRPPLHTAYIAPRNDGEQKIAELWAEHLSIDKVGIHDHFMELGGNSLLGMVLVSRLQEAFQVNLSASILYEGPTVSSLYELLQSRHTGGAAAEKTMERASLRKELRQQQLQKRRIRS
jgi:acyl carrier protein